MEQLDITTAFDRQISVPAVSDLQELEVALNEFKAFGDSNTARAAVEAVRGNTSSDDVRVGIKTILTTAETAKLSADPVGWFADQLAGQVARYNPGFGGR